MSMLNTRYFITGMIALSSLISIITISEHSFPWTEASTRSIAVVPPGGSVPQNQEYRGAWGLRAVRLCIDSPVTGKRSCYVTGYTKAPEENPFISRYDPRTDLSLCKSNGNAIFGIIVFMVIVDALCIPAFLSVSVRKYLSETTLKSMRAFSVGGALFFWTINLITWSSGCHGAVKSFNSEAHLSA